ncbi:MAG: hypothetical protein ACI9A1_001767 [Lentimonas sp.]
MGFCLRVSFASLSWQTDARLDSFRISLTLQLLVALRLIAHFEVCVCSCGVRGVVGREREDLVAASFELWLDFAEPCEMTSAVGAPAATIEDDDARFGRCELGELHVFAVGSLHSGGWHCAADRQRLNIRGRTREYRAVADAGEE